MSEQIYRGASEVFRLRTSRKRRRCDYSRDPSWYHPCSGIEAGQQYVHVTVYPGHDFINIDRPQVGACCLRCAAGHEGMDTLVPATDPASAPGRDGLEGK